MSLNNLTLYELTNERLQLQHKLEALNLDECTIADTLEGESGALERKIEDYGWVMLGMEQYINSIKAEKERLDGRLALKEKQLTSIKDWLREGMVAAGISKIDCPVFSITIKTNPPKVVIDAESQIPNEFWIVPEPVEPVPRINKTLIQAAIKEGREVNGAHIEQSKRLDFK